MIAGAVDESEENYAYLEEHKLDNYLKPSTFCQDTNRYRNSEIIRKYQFRSNPFDYDPQTDEFICPNKQRLHYLYAGKYKMING